MGLPFVMPGKAINACEGHLKAASGQAAEAIPNITDYAAEGHVQ